MNRKVIRASLVLLVVLTFGSTSGAAFVCAWTWAPVHDLAEAPGHHDCEEPAADVVMVGTGAHCEEHSAPSNLVAVASLSASSAPTVAHGGLASELAVSSRPVPVAVTRRGAGPPPSHNRTILRI